MAWRTASWKIGLGSAARRGSRGLVLVEHAPHGRDDLGADRLGASGRGSDHHVHVGRLGDRRVEITIPAIWSMLRSRFPHASPGGHALELARLSRARESTSLSLGLEPDSTITDRAVL